MPNAHVNPPALRLRSADPKAHAFGRSVFNVLLGMFLLCPDERNVRRAHIDTQPQSLNHLNYRFVSRAHARTRADDDLFHTTENVKRRLWSLLVGDYEPTAIEVIDRKDFRLR